VTEREREREKEKEIGKQVIGPLHTIHCTATERERQQQHHHPGLTLQVALLDQGDIIRVPISWLIHLPRNRLHPYRAMPVAVTFEMNGVRLVPSVETRRHLLVWLQTAKLNCHWRLDGQVDWQQFDCQVDWRQFHWTVGDGIVMFRRSSSTIGDGSVMFRRASSTIGNATVMFRRASRRCSDGDRRERDGDSDNGED